MTRGIEWPGGGGKLLAFVGLGFWQAWWMVAMCTDVLLPDPVESPFPFSLTILLLTLSCLGYLVIIVAHEAGLQNVLGFRGLAIVAGALAFGGSLGMGIISHGSFLGSFGGMPFVAAAAAFSLGNAMLLIIWGSLWSVLATGYVGRLLCASYTAAFFLFFIIRALPLGLAVTITALLPIASLAGYAFARTAPHRTAVRRKGIAWSDLPVGKALVALFVANFVWGMSQKCLYVGMSGYPGLPFALGAVFLLAFTVFMFAVSSTDEASSLLRPVVPALICGIALMQALPSEDMFLGEGIMIYGGYCLDMLVMLVASDMAFKMQASVVRVFGITLFVARVGSLVGTVAGEWYPMMDFSRVTVSMISIILLVVAGMLLFSQSELSRFYRVQPHPVTGALLEERCSVLAEVHGLTPRESEVLDLLARGRSAPFISQELCMALGTAKNHISSIYRKVGVNDRQSLHNVIEDTPIR